MWVKQNKREINVMKNIFKFNKAIRLFLFFTIISFSGIVAQTEVPSLNVVGSGYNIFGKYAEASSVTYPIFQWSANQKIKGGKDYVAPPEITVTYIGTKSRKEISGSSQREYAKSFSQEVEVGYEGPAFSASVNVAYSKSWGGSSSEYYLTILDANRVWELGIDKRINLKQFMTEQAKADINNMDPMELFETYGTHYIANAFIGSRADYTTVTNNESKFSEREIKVAVEGSYGAISGSSTTGHTTSTKSILENTKSTLIVNGGNYQYANDIKDKETYTKWADGVESNPVLCDFEKGSLKPIWALADSPARQSQLQTAFNEYAKGFPLPDYIESGSEMFVLSALDGNMALTVKGGKDKNGTNIELSNGSAEESQQFYFETGDKGRLLIRSKGRNYLGVDASGNVQLFDNALSDNQAWKRVNTGDGFQYIENVGTQKALTVALDDDEKETNPIKSGILKKKFKFGPIKKDKIKEALNNDDSGANIIVTPYKKLKSQKWRLSSPENLFSLGPNMYKEKWKKDWKITRFLQVKDSPFLLLYGRDKKANVQPIVINEDKIELIKDKGEHYSKEWSSGWSMIDFFKMGDSTYHMAIKEKSGNVSINQYDYTGAPKEIWSADWSGGWSTLETFSMGGKTYAFIYKKGKGVAKIHELDPKPSKDAIWEIETLNQNIVSAQHFTMGKEHFLLLHSLDGTCWTYSIEKTKGGIEMTEVSKNTKLEPNIDTAMVIDYHTGPVLFMYKKQTGTAWFTPLHSDGSLGKAWKKTLWGKDWTDFDYFKKDDHYYFLKHKEKGETEIYKLK